jgi:hypothetical protein
MLGELLCNKCFIDSCLKVELLREPNHQQRIHSKGKRNAGLRRRLAGNPFSRRSQRLAARPGIQKGMRVGHSGGECRTEPVPTVAERT